MNDTLEQFFPAFPDYASGLFVGEYKGLKMISHGGSFQFATNNEGNISGFTLAAGRVKNLKFSKL